MRGGRSDAQSSGLRQALQAVRFAEETALETNTGVNCREQDQSSGLRLALLAVQAAEANSRGESAYIDNVPRTPRTRQARGFSFRDFSLRDRFSIRDFSASFGFRTFNSSYFVRTSSNKPYFCYLVTLICAVIFIWEMGVANWEFASWDSNPFLGPPAEVLVKCGAQVSGCILEGQWWRLFASQVILVDLLYTVC